MPTVSAAQALQDLKSSPTRYISTGLSLLDALLQNREPVVTGNGQLFGGLSRGRVTEIYGPPGVGKTTLGFVLGCPFFLASLIDFSMQLAASALHVGEGVVWVG
jgi:hypothetical protein